MASVQGYSQFRERNRNAHVAIRGLESQWESPVLSPAFDSGRCSVAVMQLWSGGHLIWRSAQGLLDYSDPDAGQEIRQKLDAICGELGIRYHGVRFRTTGYRQLVEVHLLFPATILLTDAHRLATLVEERLPKELSMPAEVITHLETEHDHEQVHSEQHYTSLPR